MTLKTCPVCHSEAEEIEPDNKNVSAIYCTVCPVGVSDGRLSIKALRKIWNLMPRLDKPVLSSRKFTDFLHKDR